LRALCFAGGLYARYAIALLFDPPSGQVAGLQPTTFLTTATPHLGVGRHGHLGLLPSPLQSLGGAFLGSSIRELLLRDGGAGGTPLLFRMASESDSQPECGPPFMAALRAFAARRAYANAVNDALVPYETAAFCVEPRLAPRADALRGAPRVLYSRARPMETETAITSADRGHADAPALQREMAARLAGLGWTETAVAFPSLLPMAHNRIVALRRDPVLTAMNACGMDVVRHTAAALLADAEGILALAR